jgi:hypothetical protein
LKLSKTSWLILIVGVVIVAFASLGLARSSQANEHEQLNEELTVAEMRLANFQLKDLQARKGEVEAQLDEATAQLKAVKDDLSQSNESIDVTDFLFMTAQACGVVINDIHSSDLSSDELADVNCLVIRLSIAVAGDVPSLIHFVARLNTDFTTGVVDSVDISIPEITEEEVGGVETENSTEPEEPEIPSASIRLSVYSYQGN